VKLPVGMAERALGDEIANCVGVGVRFLFRQIARAGAQGDRAIDGLSCLTDLDLVRSSLLM